MDSEQIPTSSSDFEELQDLIIQSFRRRFILGRKKNRERRRFRATDPESEGSNRKLVLNFFRKLEEFTEFVEYFQNACFDPDEESVSIGEENPKASSCPMSDRDCETSSITTPSFKRDTSQSPNFSDVVRDILLKLSKSLKTFEKKSSLVLDSVEHGTNPDRRNAQFLHHIIQVFHVLVDFVKELLFRSLKSLKLNSSINNEPAGESSCSCTTSEISNDDDMAHTKADMLEWRRNLPERDDDEDGMTSSNEEDWIKSVLVAHEEPNSSDSKSIPTKDFNEKSKASGTKSTDEIDSITIPNEFVNQLEETKTMIGSLAEDMNRFILGLDIPALDDVSLKTAERKCSEGSKNTLNILQDNNISSAQTIQTPDEVGNPIKNFGEDTRKKCKSCKRVPEDQMPLLDQDTNVAVLLNNEADPTLILTDYLPFLCNLCTIAENRVLERNPSIPGEDSLSVSQECEQFLANCESFTNLSNEEESSDHNCSPIFETPNEEGSSNQNCSPICEISNEEESSDQNCSPICKIPSIESPDACKEQSVNLDVTDIYEDEDKDEFPVENFCCAAPSNNIHQCNSQINDEQDKADDPQSPEENAPYLVFQPGSVGFAMTQSQSQSRGKNHAGNLTKEESYHHIVSLDVTHFANVIKERMVQSHQEEIERGVPMSGIENEFILLTLLSECIQQSFEIVSENTSYEHHNDTSQNKDEQCNETPADNQNLQFQVPEENILQSKENEECIEMDSLENEKFKNIKESFEQTMATLRTLSDESLATRLSFDASQNAIPGSDCKSDATQENKQFTKLIEQLNKGCAKCSRDRENYLALVSTGLLSHDEEHGSRKPISPEPHEHHTEQDQYFADLIEVREIKEAKIKVYVVERPEGLQNTEKTGQIPFNKNESSHESRSTGLKRSNENCHHVLEPKDSALNAFHENVLSLRYLQGPRLLLKVHSESFTDETFSLLMCSSPISLHYYKDIQVMFKDQQGKVIEDYALEQYFFFTLLAAHIFTVHDKKLFQPSSPESSSICLNPACPMPSTWFQFAGVILAISLLHQKPLGIQLPQSFFKCLLDRELTIDDIQEIDPHLHHRLCWIAETKLSEFPTCFNFTIDEQTSDNRTLELEIIPNGKNIFVTDDNKVDYIENAIEWRLIGRCHAEMNDFKKGFNMVLDPTLLSGFTVGELQNLVMSGYLEG